MAPELQKNAVSGISTRQKAIGGAFVIIVLIIIWQVMGLFGSGKSSATMAPVSTTKKNTLSASQPGATMTAEQDESQIKQAPIPVDNQLMKQQRESEQLYVSKLSELESLKIQREIAETNQAIAAAKLATVTAEKGISDLLTKPALPQVSAGDYAASLANPVRSGETIANQPVAPAAVPPDVPYTVISVSMQLHRWSAVLGYQGKLYNVSVGDVLPLDGSVIEKINKDGVMIRKNGKTRKVSLVSAI